METETLESHLGRPVTIDLCQSCQAFWFDARESVGLAPAATLTLFRLIGERAARPQQPAGGACPRCRGQLHLTHDMQRDVRFQYYSCPEGHGRLTSFFDFLREKNFIRPLSPEQVAELRQNVQSVNCSNCGAAVDLTHGSACTHCGSPLSMLDIKQAGMLVTQLQHAEDRTRRPPDPSLPLELERARREVEMAFGSMDRNDVWFQTASADGLVAAGLQALARWIKRAR